MLMLRKFRPVVEFVFVFRMLALYFLQKHDVSIQALNLFAHIVNHQTTVERTQALVDVIGGDGDTFGHGWCKFSQAESTDAERRGNSRMASRLVGEKHSGAALS